MLEKILETLKKTSSYISGEELSDRLKITRQALWKHIHELKGLGYDIVAVPHLGYKFISSPDRLFPFEVNYQLNTKVMGKRIYYFESVSSTMDIAAQLGMQGLLEGTLVLAETQTKGRGRLGRFWLSPKYKGIYLSLILRPKMQPNCIAMLTLLSAVSICEAIKDKLDLEPMIKWPNDIMIRNKKLGGILTELNAEADRINFVIIGIGLNINNDKKSLPESATSIKEQIHQHVNRITVLQELLRRLETNYLVFQKQGSYPIIKRWRQFSLTLGKRVKIISQKMHLEGQAVDIDVDGGLLLRKDSGLIEKVLAGDIIHLR
ncbi:MAG: biotin--[acetyl-CoA-carboxylase] ligase [Candidatus Omnitrophica bacterium]|nr:biotin--[acetyl-CoA-carboxylase] ligase [Candidatus Omnitrophota bacterium]